MDILEYLVRLRGAEAAAAQVRGLKGEMNELAASQRRVGAEGSRLGGILGVAGKGIAALGAVAVATGLEAVKMSTSFNHEMLRIRTDAGASTRELQNMKKGVLDLAASGASMGQGPMSLAQGLYHLESLGIRGSRALHALKLASQESAISGASLEQTTSALGAAMYTGIKGTGDLTHLMGTLNATVGAGNMRFQDLVDALGTGVLPSAKVAGLSMQDVGAALAVATDAGYKASSAAAQLGTAFHFLYAPTDKAKVALKSIHLGSNTLAQDMHKPQGLLVALRDLKDHLHGLSQVQQAQVLNSILPGGRGRILLTELTMLDRLRGKYKQINATAGGFQGSVAMQRKDPMTQLHTAVAGFQANMIRLGNVLTPVVIPALATIVHWGSAVLQWLIKLPSAIGKVTGLFSGAGHTFSSAGSTISKAFTSIGHTASALWTVLSHAFSQIIAAARKTFNLEFVHDLATVGSKLVQFGALIFSVVGRIVKMVLPFIVNGFKAAFRIIKGVVEVFAGLFTLDFSKMWEGIKNIFGGAIGWIVNFLKGSVTVMLAPAQLIVNAIVGVFNSLGSLIGQAFTGAINIVIGILNFAIDRINSLLGAINAVTGSIPLVGGSLHIGSIGHITPVGSSPTPSATSPGSPGHVRGLSTPHSAHGSSVWMGGLVTVGEQGREIVNLPRGATVTPMAKAGPGSGDLVLKIAEHEFARISKRSLWKAMAANA